MSGWPERPTVEGWTPERVQALAFSPLNRHGAQPQFECARMVHGPAPDWPMSRIDGVTSYELG